MGHKVEAGPERVRDHIPRPHPNKMIIDQIRSTVNLIDPTGDSRVCIGLAIFDCSAG
jgi:hypothetical protein